MLPLILCPPALLTSQKNVFIEQFSSTNQKLSKMQHSSLQSSIENVEICIALIFSFNLASKKG